MVFFLVRGVFFLDRVERFDVDADRRDLVLAFVLARGFVAVFVREFLAAVDAVLRVVDLRAVDRREAVPVSRTLGRGNMPSSIMCKPS